MSDLESKKQASFDSYEDLLAYLEELKSGGVHANDIIILTPPPH